MGCHSLLQGIFPTQGSNSGLPHCRNIHYHLSHQGNPVYRVCVCVCVCVWSLLWVLYRRNHCLIQDHKDLLLFFLLTVLRHFWFSFLFSAMLHGMRDLSSPTRGQTCAPYGSSWSAGSSTLDLQGISTCSFLKQPFHIFSSLDKPLSPPCPQFQLMTSSPFCWENRNIQKGIPPLPFFRSVNGPVSLFILFKVTHLRLGSAPSLLSPGLHCFCFLSSVSPCLWLKQALLAFL